MVNINTSDAQKAGWVVKKATINWINLHKAAKNRRAPPHPPQMLMKPQSRACECESRSGTGSTGRRLHCLSCQGMLTPGRIPIVPKLQCWISAELRAHSGIYCRTEGGGGGLRLGQQHAGAAPATRGGSNPPEPSGTPDAALLLGGTMACYRRQPAGEGRSVYRG